MSNILDIDECNLWSDRGGRLCVGVCTNTPGSYTCGCPDGYRMLGDGRTCQGKLQKNLTKYFLGYFKKKPIESLSLRRLDFFLSR